MPPVGLRPCGYLDGELGQVHGACVVGAWESSSGAAESAAFSWLAPLAVRGRCPTCPSWLQHNKRKSEHSVAGTGLHDVSVG